jgi:hypothetical protein
MAETLAAILTAHLLGDFIFQTNWIVNGKRQVHVLLLHVTILTIASWLLMGAFHWPILLAIFLTHIGMDAIKVHKMTDSWVAFVIDQSVHLAVLVGLACLYPDAALGGYWATRLKAGQVEWYFASLCFLSGLIVVVPAGGILIGKVTSPLTKEIGNEDIAGLKKGGRYIGWLERSLVMLLLLINQPTGIGFLFAAKSILRFGEIKDASQRKVAEYIIIGTFLSFGWALLFSTLTQNAIQHWLPPKVSETSAPTIIVAPSPATPSSATSSPTPSTQAANDAATHDDTGTAADNNIDDHAHDHDNHEDDTHDHRDTGA